MYIYILFLLSVLIPISYAITTRRKYNLDANPLSFKFKHNYNHPIEDSIDGMVELFNSAKNTIKIVGGELNSQVYDNDAVLMSLEAALKRGVIIRMISGPKIDGGDERLMKLASKYKNQFYLKKLDERATYHYRIVDNENVYIEGYHEELQRDNRNSILINDTKYTGKNLEREFDAMASTCKSANPDNYLTEYNVLNNNN